MVTRADVIDNAASFLPPRMPSWTPERDTFCFDPANTAHTFHSSYVVGQRYDVMPYVLGGFDSPARFLEQMRKGTCPGGWDRRSPLPGELPGRHTRCWARKPPLGLGYGLRVPQHLAGIDCSGFVLRCWGFARRRIDGVLYRTKNLADLCVPVTRASLKPGDVLNWADHHVRLFKEDRGDLIDILEAFGGEGHPRAYAEGDMLGRVLNRDVAWEDCYAPCSPFPQLTTFQPVPETQIETVQPLPAIEAEFIGSGKLAVVELLLDGAPAACQTLSTAPLRVRCAPRNALHAGGHTIQIAVVNRIGGQAFQDSFACHFACHHR